MSFFSGVSELVKRTTRAWFLLTREEQKAVLLVTALFLLGLGAMIWRRESGASRQAGEAGQPPSWSEMAGEYSASNVASGTAARATLSIRDRQAVLVLGEHTHNMRLYRDFGPDSTALLQETIETKDRKYRRTWPVRAFPDRSLELDHIRFLPAVQAPDAPPANQDLKRAQAD